MNVGVFLNFISILFAQSATSPSVLNTNPMPDCGMGEVAGALEYSGLDEDHGGYSAGY
jgi:hypothetical protein